MNKGQREIEIWNTFRTGRDDFYARLDNRTEFEIGLGAKLQTAFYLNLTSKTKGTGEAETNRFKRKMRSAFPMNGNLNLWMRSQILLGYALYGEYGIGSSEFELEGKLILDKKINNLTIAANAVYEAEFAPLYLNGNLDWGQESKLEFYLALGYSLNQDSILLWKTP